MAPQRPYSEACERNREPILAILRATFADVRTVLEIGSGTGQHGVYFAGALPHLTWQTSDLPFNHPGIQAWIQEAGLPNLRPPLSLDVNERPFPVADMDAIFTANTLHIVSWTEVQHMFDGIEQALRAGGPLCVYGPFNYNGTYTSESNAGFDAMLRARDPQSGIRDFEDISGLALRNGLRFETDHAMPANNRILVFRKNRQSE